MKKHILRAIESLAAQDTSRVTVWNMTKRGVLRQIELWPGGPKRYRRKDIEALMEGKKATA